MPVTVVDNKRNELTSNVKINPSQESSGHQLNWDMLSCHQNWPQTHYVAGVDIVVLILQPLSPRHRDCKYHAWFIPEFRKVASEVWGLHVWPTLTGPVSWIFLSSRHFQIHKCQKRIFPVLYKHVNKAKVTWQGNLFLCGRCASFQSEKASTPGLKVHLVFILTWWWVSHLIGEGWASQSDTIG